MKKRISLSAFIQENLQQIPSEILTEIDDMLEKASNITNYKKAYEISSPLFENLNNKRNNGYNELSIQSKEYENFINKQYIYNTE